MTHVRGDDLSQADLEIELGGGEKRFPYEIRRSKEKHGSEDRPLRVSVAAGALGEGAERDARFAGGFRTVEAGARSGGGKRLPVFAGLQRKI